MLNSAVKANFLILREAFTALLPVVIIMNSVVLLSGLISWFSVGEFANLLVSQGNEVSRLFFFLIPLFLNISLSTLIAKEKNLDQIGTTLITMVCFFRAASFLNINDSAEIVSFHGSVLTSIPCTWAAVYLLHYLSQRFRHQLVKPTGDISPRLRSTLNLLIPGLLTILSFELFRYLSQQIVHTEVFSQLTEPFSYIRSLGTIQKLLVYKAIALTTWFIGLHGDHTAEGFFRILHEVPVGDPYSIRLKSFQDVFANIGGAGSTFVIPFLILLKNKTAPFKAIARLSIPFSIFNINEILLFGLPILLNPIFLIPFIAVSFINIAIALIAIHLGLFSITVDSLNWMTPPIYSAYAISGGSIAAVCTQLLCIFIDGCIYLPFLTIAARQHNAPTQLQSLIGEDAYCLINEEILHRQERQFISSQKRHISQKAAAQQVLKQLQNGHFILYYQPKVEAVSLRLIGIESLLRFKTFQGEVLPPTFLPVLYEQGLSKFVDKKVIDLVFEQVQKWQTQNLQVPPISINFDKDFLLDPQAVSDFITRSQKHSINFYIEITEHTYTVEIKALAAVVERLRQAGHYISIDDFGAGYSSLTSLLSLKADEIKLDRGLVASPSQEALRGQVLLAASVKLCHDLGFTVVAEGIETPEQLRLAQRCGADILQGYYLGRPMSAKSVSRLFYPNAVSNKKQSVQPRRYA